MKPNEQTLRDFFNQHTAAITHIAVAHTHYRPSNCTPLQIERMLTEARKQVRHFRNCFNQFLYQAKARRKPLEFQPLLLTTVEGASGLVSREKTIHFNFSIGNIPKCISTDELRAVFEHCWVEKAQLNGNKLWLVEANTMHSKEGWHSYITKEAERGNTATWDFENTQIPYVALANGQQA